MLALVLSLLLSMIKNYIHFLYCKIEDCKERVRDMGQFCILMCWSYIDTLVSGSPILQDGRIVGALTHVLIGDPTTGYGIFIGNMLSADTLS